MKLNVIALAHANEFAGHLAAERPKQILDAVGKLLHHFAHFEIHDNLRGRLARNRRRHIRRVRKRRDFFALDTRVDNLFAVGLGGGGFSGGRGENSRGDRCEEQTF